MSCTHHQNLNNKLVTASIKWIDPQISSASLIIFYSKKQSHQQKACSRTKYTTIFAKQLFKKDEIIVNDSTLINIKLTRNCPTNFGKQETIVQL